MLIFIEIFIDTRYRFSLTSSLEKQLIRKSLINPKKDSKNLSVYVGYDIIGKEI